MRRIIGIDLGTTNSLVAVWESGKATLIPNSLGEYLTPSVVGIDEKGTVYVGKIAKERLVSHPKQTVNVFKPLMGTSKTYLFPQKRYRAEELSALILRSLKEDAERYLGETIDEAIISVPAYFNDMARKATRDAGLLAGLKVERIVNEPSAAALAYQTTDALEECLLLVFDFGGGTLDVSLVECFENVVEIIAVSGDNRLGGTDFDKVIAERFCEEHNMVFMALEKDMQEVILDQAETLKRALSEAESATMTVVYQDFSGSLELDSKKLIQISNTLFQRIATPIEKVLQDARIPKEHLSHVIMVGGSSNMPVVQQYLRYLLKGRPILNVEPEYLIARGLGVYAGIKERKADIKDVLLTDICPFSLGIDCHNENDHDNPYMFNLIERNSALPISREERFYTIYDYQKEIIVSVYQGENMYAMQNILLGSMVVRVSPKKVGEEYIIVRFTYDINGLLVVDVRVPSLKIEKQLVIVSDGNTIPPQEMARRLKELEVLKIHPKEREEYQLIKARGERLYAQLSGDMREMVAEKARYFNYLLEKQDELLIQKGGKHIIEFYDFVELSYINSFQFWDKDANLSKWIDEDMEDEADYEEWSGKLLH